jgi:uncharacterized repeat protein (TIGR01451 family)/LPXTG-motif cell wall-anchored protein
MKNRILITVLTVFSLVTLLSPITAKADSYSNDDNRKTLSVDKTLRPFGWSYYVDNISSSTKVFYNGEIIEFKVKVTNTGTTNMKNIKVSDNLPPFLKLIFFPGTYNSTNNKVEWTIDELNAGHSQEFLIRAKIDQANEVYTLTKETNVAVAKVDEISEKDDAIYYIKSGTSSTESTVVLPETGSMSLVLETIGAISVGISGFALRRKIRGY